MRGREGERGRGMNREIEDNESSAKLNRTQHFEKKRKTRNRFQ